MGSRCAASSMVLGLALMGAAPALPEGFWRLPAEMRARATVVVSGRFQQGRGPCEFLPDGSRRWPLLRGFTPTTTYRGEVRTGYIGVESPRLLGSEEAGAGFVEGREYLLLLRPSQASLDVLRKREGNTGRREALPAKEVIAIVEP